MSVGRKATNLSGLVRVALPPLADAARARTLRALIIHWLVLVMVCPNPQDVVAQRTGSLEGKVIEAESGKRLPGVALGFPGVGMTVKTDDSGSYELTGLAAGVITVRVTLRGYATAVENVTIVADRVTLADFRLMPLTAVLDDVFVHADYDQRRQVVDMDALAMASAMQTLDGAIPGAIVYRPSGNLGAGMNVVIRGLTSFTQRNDPLIFVDGVRVSEPNTTIRGDRGLTVLELLDPVQIERIEVLTGPDATTRYGLGARNGVILIYTKLR